MHVWFGYDQPAVWPLINTLGRGALDQVLNGFLPTMKLERKERVGSKTVRHYGPPRMPPARVLDCPGASAETKVWLRAEKAALSPFVVRREVDPQLKEIETQP